MERVAGSNPDREAITRHLDAAGGALKALDALATPDGATLSGKIVSQYLGVAIKELGGVEQQMSLDSNQPAEAARVACSFCGRMIMPASTLCGFCWRRRSEPAAA